METEGKRWSELVYLLQDYKVEYLSKVYQQIILEELGSDFTRDMGEALECDIGDQLDSEKLISIQQTSYQQKEDAYLILEELRKSNLGLDDEMEKTTLNVVFCYCSGQMEKTTLNVVCLF
ncbi:hypothetical protein H5410_013821 [Solanum commersonii]|uniref:Uncharacterized protein n=1 Tax=Solanum commersonii TaxID=4109 RepID=A0A9J5ZP76_SOLCO|nr:hypothetical protein H5410_013821 [Solanum commersonii]